jgi:hypothetical protein
MKNVNLDNVSWLPVRTLVLEASDKFFGNQRDTDILCWGIFLAGTRPVADTREFIIGELRDVRGR